MAHLMNKINFSSHIGAHSNHGAHSSIHTCRKKRDIMTFAVGNNPAVSKRDVFRPQRGSFVDSIFSFVTWPPRETAQVEVKFRAACFLFTLLLSSCRPAFLPSCLSVRTSSRCSTFAIFGQQGLPAPPAASQSLQRAR